MRARSGRSRRKSRRSVALSRFTQRWFAPLLFLLLITIVALRFASVQSIGLEESFYLDALARAWSGDRVAATLTLVAHRDTLLGFVMDQMVYGLTDKPIIMLRLLNFIVAAAGLLIFLRAYATIFGRQAAGFAALVLALCPRLIEAAVEIGPAPWLIGFSAALLAFLVRSRAGWTSRTLLGFTLTAIALVYVHRAGLLLATSAFVCVLLLERGEATRKRLLRAAGLFLLAWAPMIYMGFGWPRAMDAGFIPESGIGAVIGAPARLLVPSPLLVWFASTAAVMIGFGGCLLATVLAMRAERLDELHEAELRQLVMPLFYISLIALAASFTLGILVPWSRLGTAFDYAWLLPFTAALIAATFVPGMLPRVQWLRLMRDVCAMLLVAGLAWGQLFFLYRAPWFTHGPERTLSRLVGAAPPGTALVYIGADWGHGYYPLYWTMPGKADQWLLAGDGRAVFRIAPGGRVESTSYDPSALKSYRALIVARIERRSARALRGLLEIDAFGVDPIREADRFGRHWRAAQAMAVPGTYWLTYQRLDK
jgi:hypothetical protein